MNVFSKITFQSLKKNRSRTIVTIIGVILSVSMFTAVTTFASSLQKYNLLNVIENYGEWVVRYESVGNEFIEKMKQDEEVSDIYLVENIGNTQLSTLLENSDEEITFDIDVIGLDAHAFLNLPISYLLGKLPENDSEIIVPRTISSTFEYSVDDTITLEGKDYVIVGTYAYLGFDDSYMFITRREMMDSDSTFAAFIKLENPYSTFAFNDKIISSPDEYGVSDQNRMYNSQYLNAMGITISGKGLNKDMLYLGGILIAVIMVGSVLLIYNSFSISVSERMRQFGILSSVGATKKQLRKSVLAEGFYISIIGIPLGVLAGILGMWATLGFLSNTLVAIASSNPKIPLSISAISIITAVLIGLITIFISAYIPARRAMKVSAIESIRQTTTVKINPKKVKTSKLTEKIFGLEGVLAAKNFKRNKKRYRATIISLFISVVLFITAGAFTKYLRQASGADLMDTVSYNIIGGFTQNATDEAQFFDTFEMLKNVDGVTDSQYMFHLRQMVEVPLQLLDNHYIERRGFTEGSQELLSIIIVDDLVYEDYLKDLGKKADNLNESDFIAVADSNFKKTDSADLKIFTPDAKEGKIFPVIFVDKFPETFKGWHFSNIAIIVPYSQKDEFGFAFEDAPQSMVFSSKTEEKTFAEMMSVIEENQLDGVFHLFSVSEQMEDLLRTITIINLFTYGFVALISLITIANVFNTVSTSVKLRSREFAMLMSVGMTGGGLNKMMVFECLFYGLKALLYGLPVSIGIAYLIFGNSMALFGIDVPFAPPWESVGIAVFSVFTVVFVTMLYSVGKVKKQNTVETLRKDAV